MDIIAFYSYALIASVVVLAYILLHVFCETLADFKRDKCCKYDSFYAYLKETYGWYFKH